ncbi:MAG: hypothetical protein AMK71_11190 [Nitrospira bacterium SG8_35_4]|nr:MAG: hypothetical protein AMK71_11190 [Nitrospira bacterium SG8_35_4]
MKTIHTGDKNFNALWEQGFRAIPGATPMYSPATREYDHEIFSTQLKSDDSFVVLSASGETAAVVPLYCFRDEEGALEYRYGREYVRAPIINVSSGLKNYKKIQKFIFEYIEGLAHKKRVRAHKAVVEGVELLEGRHYYNYMTDFGYIDESSICQLIDSTSDPRDLWSNVRKSYKSLINKAAKTHTFESISTDNYNFNKCEQYRNLHFRASGKQTRSTESFHLMYKMIEDGRAFMILVNDKDIGPVSAHLFYHSNGYSLYASSAVDPRLPLDAGIGHLAVWQGLLTARSMGIRYLDMGQLRIDSEMTAKEMKIALFKKGFGGKTVTVFRGTKYFKSE